MGTSLLLRTMLATFAVALITATVLDDAYARDRERSGSYVTGRGRSGEYSTDVTRGRGQGITRDRTITTEGGRTFNRSTNTTHDKANGTFTRETTGPRGETQTFTGTAANGNRSGTYSTSTGKSGTFNSEVTPNEGGGRTINRTWTNQSGETKSETVSKSYDKDTNTLNRTVTGPNGNTRENALTVTPSTPQ